ncbi:hypothetical protein HK405_005436, partial [Cladochytrium tenue]
TGRGDLVIYMVDSLGLDRSSSMKKPFLNAVRAAISCENLKILRMLVERGAPFVDLESLLHYATTEDSRWYLDKNNVRGRILTLLTNGATLDYGDAVLLHVIESIFERATESEVVSMLKKAHHPPGFRPSPKWLITAARRDQLEAIRLLAKLGADLCCRDGYERVNTALHFAASGGHAEAVKLLAELGADVHACNGDGDTPLHMALKFRRTDTVAQLLSLGARVDVANKAQQHPIHLAVQYGEPDAVRLLIDAGASVDTRTDARDLPIHLAAKKGHEHVIRMLLGAAADPRAWDVANADGLRPIHVAYIRRHMDAVKVLLEDGAADPACDADRMKSMTPVHLAVKAGSTATLTRLLRPSSDPAAPAADFDVADSDGYRPLHFAAEQGDVVAIRLLLAHGAAASDPPGTECYSPLYLAAWGDHADVVRMLLDHGAELGDN